MKRMKTLNRWLIICVIFCVIFIVHIVMSDFTKRMCVYPDEMRYLGLARSILHGEFTLHNTATNFQKILYSLFIAPAFLLESPIHQVKAVSWINCALSASAVFPAWLLVQKLMPSGWKQYLMVCITGFMPYTLLTMTFMSEVLFLPLSLWTLWGGYHTLCEPKLKIRLRWSILFGFLCYLSYLNKEIALYYLLALAAVLLGLIIQNVGNRKSDILTLVTVVGCFAVCFVAAKVFVFTGLGNSYSQQDLSSVLSLDKIIYMCYALVYNGLFSILAFGVFPVLLILVNIRDKQGKHKRFFCFVLAALMIGIGAIVYTISVREDFPNISIRQHMRYLDPLLIPLLAGILCIVPEKKERNRVFIGTIIVSVLIILTFHRIGTGSIVDNQSLIYYNAAIDEINNILNHEWGEWLMKIGVAVLLILIVCVLRFRKNYREFLCVFLVAFCGVQTANLSFGYEQIRSDYQISEDDYLEIERLSNDLKRLEGNVLIISPRGLGIDNCLMDTYLDFQDLYITSIEYDEMASALSDGILQLNSESVFVEFPWGYYKNLTHAEYILAEKNVKLSGVEMMGVYQIEYEYVLYKNLEPSHIYVGEEQE